MVCCGLLFCLSLPILFQLTDDSDPRSSGHCSSPYIVSRCLHEYMDLEHQILFHYFALENTVIITAGRGELAKNNYKEGSHIPRFMWERFIGNRDYNLVHFSRDGRGIHITFGHGREDRSWRWLHVWLWSFSNFCLYILIIFLSLMFSPWVNLNSLQSKDLARYKWIYFYSGPSSLSRSIMLHLWYSSVYAVKADLTTSHYPFRQCHAFSASPWTANPQRIVHCQNLTIAKFSLNEHLWETHSLVDLTGAWSSYYRNKIKLSMCYILGVPRVRKATTAELPVGGWKINALQILILTSRCQGCTITAWKTPYWWGYSDMFGEEELSLLRCLGPELADHSCLLTFPDFYQGCFGLGLLWWVSRMFQHCWTHGRCNMDENTWQMYYRWKVSQWLCGVSFTR